MKEPKKLNAMYKILMSLLCVCAVAVCAAQAQLPEDVQQCIRQRVDQGIYPGVAVALIDSSGTQYFNFGKTSEDGTSIDEHSIFEIGSITKTFTAILLADMVLKGKLKLDDPAQKYLPKKAHIPTRNGAEITLGELSDHTSGLPRMPDNFNPADQANPYVDYTVQQLYDFLSGYELTRDIGSQYEYSNLAQGLLGHILALQAGKSYEQLMVDVIANPLNMAETRITFTPEMKAHLALPHSRGQVVSNWDLGTLSGAGAIRSSAYDMSRYVAANLGFVKSPLYDAMLLTHQERHHKGSTGVGLGWHISSAPEGSIFQHNGGTGGYRTFIGFNKETGKGAVVLVNADTGADDIGMHLLDPGRKLETMLPLVATALQSYIASHGKEGLEDYFATLKRDKANAYTFDEMDINGLGYYYLSAGKIDIAKVLFKINTEQFPGSFNVWDSYAEAQMLLGDTTSAIANYQKSIEMNPGNSNGIEMLKRLGVDAAMETVEIDEAILESYVGTYNLFPGFDLVITREGSHLFAQATGQQRFEIYARSVVDFFYTVVDAQVRFNADPDGRIVSLTLFQNGQEMVGMKK